MLFSRLNQTTNLGTLVVHWRPPVGLGKQGDSKLTIRNSYALMELLGSGCFGYTQRKTTSVDFGEDWDNWTRRYRGNLILIIFYSAGFIEAVPKCRFLSKHKLKCCLNWHLWENSWGLFNVVNWFLGKSFNVLDDTCSWRQFDII